MIVRFVEAGNDFNWGKFVLLRFDADELRTKSALPGFEHQLLLAGRRWDRDMTMVVDLQTGEGAAFTLEGPENVASIDLDKHRVWVCPMYEFFLRYLYGRGDLARGKGDINDVPRYVDLANAPSSMRGYRRKGADNDEVPGADPGIEVGTSPFPSEKTG